MKLKSSLKIMSKVIGLADLLSVSIWSENDLALIDTSIIIDHFRKKDKSNTRLIQLYKEK